MKHTTNIKRITQSAAMDRSTSDDLNAEVADGRAAEYENRVAFPPGYIARLAQDYIDNAEKLEKKAEALKSNYAK